MTEEATVDPVVIKRTQEILGKYVKRPPLTEKLLKKPPFRFLQDIINAIIKETGSLNGLYSKTELTAEGIIDRNAKIVFLQKLIDVIKIVSNENITARPSKIVAGHEPAKTNELLQILGKSLDKNADFKSAIEKITGSNKKDETKRRNSDTKEVKDKKVNEPKTNLKIKPNNKDKVNNQPKDNLKEKAKASTSTSKISAKEKETSKSKGKPKEKEKQKRVTKSPSLESTNEKQEPNSLLPKVKELYEIKEDAKKKTTDSSPSIQNETDVHTNDESVKLNDQIKVIPSTIESHEIIDQPPSNESIQKASTSNFNEHRKSSGKKQKQNKSSNELLSTTEDDKIKIDLNLNNDIEKSPKNIKTKANRKLSDHKLNSNKNDLILTTDEKFVTKHNDSSNKLQDLISDEQKLENNEAVSGTNRINNSQNEMPVVKRQSTFTREESKDSNGRPRTSLRPPSVRPPSARPGAPRRRDKNVEIVLQPNDQIKMAGIQLKVESFNNELEDDGENLVIIENENPNDILEDSNKKPTKEIDEVKLDENSHQGHLVQQILETQKELVQNHDVKEIKDEDLDIATIQNRQSSAKQMNSLRDLIQNLTKSINPLGKLMDFIPEDMDAMQLEMNMWRDLYSQTSVELKKEKSLTESTIEPMKNQLEQINGTIKEYTDMIDECRAKILQNSDKIFNLLTDY